MSEGFQLVYCPAGEHWVHPDEQTSITDHGRCGECQEKWRYGDLEQGWVRKAKLKAYRGQLQRLIDRYELDKTPAEVVQAIRDIHEGKRKRAGFEAPMPVWTVACYVRAAEDKEPVPSPIF